MTLTMSCVIIRYLQCPLLLGSTAIPTPVACRPPLPDLSRDMTPAAFVAGSALQRARHSADAALRKHVAAEQDDELPPAVSAQHPSTSRQQVPEVKCESK